MQLDSLSEDLFNQLGTEIEDEYYEYFMMWLSDKLFKIAKEDDITLNEAYEQYLKNNIVNFNYWSLLDIKEGLKEVNLMYMKHFYKLLNDICKAIVHYKLNNDDIEKFISNSSDCYNQYSSLYKSGMSGLECDKLAEYAILWLSYKLAIKPNNNSVNLNHFYTNYIENNKYYNDKIKGNDGPTYKEIINKKKDFMNIKEIYNFSYLFSILFYLYNVNKPNNLKCTNDSNYPEFFANKFKELNNDSKNIENISYNKMLSTLSDDYNNLKKIYGNNKHCNFPSLPKITPPKNPVQPTAISSEVTSSSSSISTTLIPGLS
ncbi:hypothetical protein YYG_05194, partial [Plasmodium vinckei petteri]